MRARSPAHRIPRRRGPANLPLQGRRYCVGREPDCHRTSSARSPCWSTASSRGSTLRGDANNSRAQTPRHGSEEVRHREILEGHERLSGSGSRHDEAPNGPAALVRCRVREFATYSSFVGQDQFDQPWSRRRYRRIAETTSAICRASRGGTAFPIWWYCAVRPPLKK